MKTFLVTVTALSTVSMLNANYYATPSSSDYYQTSDASYSYQQPSQGYYNQGYNQDSSQSYYYSQQPSTSYYSQPSQGYSQSQPAIRAYITQQPSQGYQTTGTYYTQQPSQGVISSQPAQNYRYQQGSAEMRNQDSQYFSQQNATKQTTDSLDKTASADQFTTDTDRLLAKKIRDELTGGWFSKGVDNLSLVVDNGNVTVFGESDSSDLNSISTKIRKIDGVKSVNVQITPAQKANGTLDRSATDSDRSFASGSNLNPSDRFGTEADRQLLIKVRDKLSGWFTNKYKNATISVFNATVTIDGVVDSADAQQKATQEIQKVAGVNSVSNRLTVDQSSAQ